MASHGSSGTILQHATGKRGRPATGWAPAFLDRLLSYLTHGSLIVETPAGERVRYDAPQEGPEAILVLHRWRPLRLLATKGTIGFAQGYIDGDWSSPDLTTLLELASLNLPTVGRLARGSLWARTWFKIAHVLRANTRAGSRRNIALHYDLGNAFYERWLDRSMTYSSALYTRGDATLEEAQDAKLERIAQLLGVPDGGEVLEIGCGWGALASRMARTSAAQVTALTLSRRQQEHAQAVARQAGLHDRIDVRLQDYRDVTGQFDRIVSIEMLEAVGETYWPVYFAKLRALLKEEGRAVLQVITIQDERFEHYRASADFIQTHIFPGGMLPSRTKLRTLIADAGLRLTHVETFGQSYARTLAEWRIRFHRAWPEIEKLGFDSRFRRMWDYYLCYCEAGFRTGAIDVGLYALTHVENTPSH